MVVNSSDQFISTEAEIKVDGDFMMAFRFKEDALQEEYYKYFDI
jgi:hypothetical protein